MEILSVTDGEEAGVRLVKISEGGEQYTYVLRDDDPFGIAPQLRALLDGESQ